LTVGDAYGHDANYLIDNGVQNVIASDISDEFLAVSKEVGIVEQYSAENAENLSFENNSIDYILCKETYHHFPRPYAALYEMIRVAKKGNCYNRTTRSDHENAFLVIYEQFSRKDKIWFSK